MSSTWVRLLAGSAGSGGSFGNWARESSDRRRRCTGAAGKPTGSGRQCLPLRFLHGVLDQTPQRTHAIFPADLLAFPVSTAPVADTNLVNPKVALGDLHRHFGFKAETVLFERDRLNDLAAKDFVASLHVGHVEVGDHVGGEREEPVSDRVPKIQDAMGSG